MKNKNPITGGNSNMREKTVELTEVKHSSATLKKNEGIINGNSKTLYIEKAQSFNLNIDKNSLKKTKEERIMEEVSLKYFRKKSVTRSNLKKFDFNVLKMYRLYQYCVFNTKPNQIMLQKFKEEKINIIKSIIVLIFMLGCFFFLYLFLIIMMADIYNRYRYYIIKVWLLPSLGQLLVVRFVSNYIVNFLKSYMLFKLYAMRKIKCHVRVLYCLFMRKDVIYMYKIRNFVTKYSSQLSELNKSNSKQYNKFNDEN